MNASLFLGKCSISRKGSHTAYAKFKQVEYPRREAGSSFQEVCRTGKLPVFQTTIIMTAQSIINTEVKSCDYFLKKILQGNKLFFFF